MIQDSEIEAAEAAPAPRRKRRAKAKAAKATASTAPETGAEAMPEQEAAAEGPQALSRAELIDLVVERSGVRKRDAKPAVEAALAVLGQALAEGRTLNLRPLGKARHVAVKERENARVINLRLRQTKQAEKTAPEALDPPAEDL